MQVKRLFGIVPVFAVLAMATALLVGSVPANAQQPDIQGLTTQFANNTYSYTMYDFNYWNIYGNNLGSDGYSGTAGVNVNWQTSYIQFGQINSMSYNAGYRAFSSQYWWDSPNQLNFYANGQLSLPAGVTRSDVTALTANIQVCNIGCSLTTSTGVLGY
jgi:hypothetical protein